MTMTSFRAFISTHPESVLIDLVEARGSTPREAGTFMLAAVDAIWGTIGGGQFEFIAIDHARAMLSGEARAETLDIPLGPEIGQCCGGRTLLRFATVDKALEEQLVERLKAVDEVRPAVYLFGAGHVGKAIAVALAPLPLSVSVFETRADELGELPMAVEKHLVAMPEAAVAGLPSGGAAIIVTHDHALDFLIAREALARADLAYVGMIGSATKRATFSHWLVREGCDGARLERLVLPIGGSMVKDKRPAVIAAMAAAEVLSAIAAYQRPSP